MDKSKLVITIERQYGSGGRIVGKKLAEELGIPNQILTSAYFICMENVNVLWEQLTNAYGEQEAPAENAESGKKDQ